MIAKIFFSKFNTDEINEKGWSCEEGEMYLKLTSPINDEKAIDGVDNALEHKKFAYIGEIDVRDYNQAWDTLQNVFGSHELNNRSMMIGDVMLFENEGWIVESVGFQKITDEQFNKFSNY